MQGDALQLKYLNIITCETKHCIIKCELATLNDVRGAIPRTQTHVLH